MVILILTLHWLVIYKYGRIFHAPVPCVCSWEFILKCNNLWRCFAFGLFLFSYFVEKMSVTDAFFSAHISCQRRVFLHRHFTKELLQTCTYAKHTVNKIGYGSLSSSYIWIYFIYFFFTFYSGINFCSLFLFMERISTTTRWLVNNQTSNVAHIMQTVIKKCWI